MICRAFPDMEKKLFCSSQVPNAKLYVCTSDTSISVLESIPMVEFIATFSFIELFESAIFVGILLIDA